MSDSRANETNFSFDSLLNNSSVDDNLSAKLCFDHFCHSDSNGLTVQSFKNLLNTLFVNELNAPYHLPVLWTTDLFALFDVNSDDIIDWKEFELMWINWIQVILRPKSALIVVDVQNDFISGSLAISQCPARHNGEHVIPVINKMLDNIAFEKVIYSQDWHPRDHISFFDNKHIRKFESIASNGEEVRLYDTVVFEGPPQMEQRLWPTHCVQHTWGSELHPNLNISANSVRVYKGTQSHIDSYSVFWDNQRLSQTNLNQILQTLAITDVYICGIATDVCVGFTALDAFQYGYRTIVVEDGSRGLCDDQIETIKQTLIENKAIFVNSSKVHHMVCGADRRPELGFALAFKPKPIESVDKQQII